MATLGAGKGVEEERREITRLAKTRVLSSFFSCRRSVAMRAEAGRNSAKAAVPSPLTSHWEERVSRRRCARDANLRESNKRWLKPSWS
jgi:hypothetical protein